VLRFLISRDPVMRAGIKCCCINNCRSQTSVSIIKGIVNLEKAQRGSPLEKCVDLCRLSCGNVKAISAAEKPRPN